MTATLPRFSGKVSGSTLLDLPRINLDSGEHTIIQEDSLLYETVAGHRFDYLWAPKLNANRLFVLFSGNAMRKKNAPPVFQRWSWAPHFPGHCLYVSDPMLYMHPDLGLAWYAGTHDLDPLETIISRVKKILSLLDLTARDVCSYGSSGGGFAALRMAALMPDISAIAVNPQTNIANYHKGFSDRYSRVCLNSSDRLSALADFPLRLDLTRHAEALRQRRLIVIQNRLDEHHYEEHYRPFCTALNATPDENHHSGLFRRILFEHEGGHGAAETSETFAEAMSVLESDFSDVTSAPERSA